MTAFDNQLFYIANVISNVLAILILVAAWKWKNAARLVFFLVFGLACWINWQTAFKAPEAYLTFGQVAIIPWYQQFIQGWFREHILLAVGFIATCQGLIAVAMLLSGWVYKAGLIGGIVFLLAVTPLGLGSAFPCTLILAIALMMLWRQDSRLFSSVTPRMQHG
jgi:hypothetical protein